MERTSTSVSKRIEIPIPLPCSACHAVATAKADYLLFKFPSAPGGRRSAFTGRK